MIDRDLAKIDWQQGMKPKQIAEKYGVSVNTVKSWITRHWKKETGAPDAKKGAPAPAKQVHPQQCTSTPPAGTPEMIESVIENTELNPQQQLFCLYYANYPNATQAYLRAYNCSYQTALTNGPALLGNTRIKCECDRLRQIKLNALMYSVEDFVEYNIRVLGGNMCDYATFGTVAAPGHEQGMQEGTITPQNMQNILLFKGSDKVDGSLISKISVSRDGASIQLVDKKASAQFLERYTGANPMDRHRKEYDARKQEIELIKLQASLPPATDEASSSESNFNDALEAVVGDGEVWGDEDDS